MLFETWSNQFGKEMGAVACKLEQAFDWANGKYGWNGNHGMEREEIEVVVERDAY